MVATSPDKLEECKWELEADTETFINTIEVFHLISLSRFAFNADIKANTAVLLDNAANFEGAMEAYTDACQLLQLVMLRSNGGDEEKLKLQEIVRNPFQRQNEFL